MTLTDRFARLPIVRRALTENPLAWAEQRRMRRYGVGRRPLIGLLMLVCIIGGPLALVVQEILEGVLMQNPARGVLLDMVLLSKNLVELSAIAGILAIVMQNTMITNLAPRLAGATLARERQNGTWEPLVLTGIRARRIVIGKWAAIVLVLLTRHRTALLLRIPLYIWIAVVGVRYDVLAGMLQPLNALFTLIMLLIAPVLLAGLFTALGMAISSLVSRETAAARLNGAIPIILIVGGIALVWIIQPFLQFSSIEQAEQIAAFFLGLFLPLLDSGLVGLPASFSTDPAQTYPLYFLGNVGWLVLAIALTWALLRLAGWASVRAGAIGEREQTGRRAAKNTV